MDQNNKYRLRVQNCIWTIIDVHKTICDEYENGNFFSQFEKLEETIENLDMADVSEIDVLMVEQTTNDILGEFRSLFEAGELRNVYELQES